MEFNLKNIARRLESLEETIIFRLIDRFQYAQNRAVYEAGRFSFRWSREDSLLDYKLRFAEETDAVLGRYGVAEERPFFSDLPRPDAALRRNENSAFPLDSYDAVNVCPAIRRAWIDFVCTHAAPGDDGEYGTTAELDIAALQAVARRVHFGAFYVAESKYREDPRGYDRLIDTGKSSQVLARLTRQSVEDRIIERIAEKVETIQRPSDPSLRRRICGDTVAAFYRDTVIPLTKRGEVAYLFSRRRS
ncbi:MAG: chorismate mutase [Fibrobacterota bacterium]